MHLADFYSPDTISVDLQGRGKDEILAELVGLLHLDERSTDTLLRILQRRETLGSTGVGRGIAIPQRYFPHIEHSTERCSASTAQAGSPARGRRSPLTPCSTARRFRRFHSL